MDFQYKASVIVPVYNAEEYLHDCLESMIKQTINKDDMEVLLIDDGSKDTSPAICDEYASLHSFFKVFHLENGGVSSARNFGIDHAQGKYIIFLDSDDYLSPHSVKNLVKFFDKHYDEVDLITYKQVLVSNGECKPSDHFRYNFIKKSGVYDLNDPSYRYFAQTHMNICIKNRLQDNLKFDTTMVFHEDQKFILSNLVAKNKIGFCAQAEYFYVQNATGATGMVNHPYYIHDKTIEMWENFFSSDIIPKHVQVQFLSAFRWKLITNHLWPYQYKGEDFEREKGRIISLLKKVDDDVILNFPVISQPHQAYVFSLKYGERMNVKTYDDSYKICVDNETLIDCDNIEIYFSRFHVRNNRLTIVGAVKCIATNFTDDLKAEVTYKSKSGEVTKELELRESSLSRLSSETKTNRFKLFIIKRPIDDLKKLEFTVSLMGKSYPICITYAPSCPFNRRQLRFSYLCEGMRISCKKNAVSFKKANPLRFIPATVRNVVIAPKIGYRNTLTRFAAPFYKKKHRIWLYCDSSKTVMDNAYYQFLHDIKKDDGVERYYVYNTEADIDGWFTEDMKAHLVPYGSLQHRLYGLCAEKILTSFYGMRDILSYPYGAFAYFSDIANFDVIYLQHGVLHAHLPLMYSLDRMMIDKEVISTTFEAENLTKNYCFDESFLIPSGMPRYDHIDTAKKAEKKILFAPSWRKFLVTSDGKGSWNPNEKAFLNSAFYKNTMDFLTSPRLEKALKEHGYVLDFKPHPNFRMYDKFFTLNGDTVRLAKEKVDEFSYSLFLTDFSSFLFDFLYLGRPVLYFVPDMDLFEAGLNTYRKLDIPLEDGFGALSTTGEETVDNIIALLKNDCKPDKKYTDRTDGLFLPVENHTEALYNALIDD